MLEDQSDEEI